MTMLRKIPPVPKIVSVGYFKFTIYVIWWIYYRSVDLSRFIPLDKGNVPENVWKLGVTYVFEDTDFPFGEL